MRKERHDMSITETRPDMHEGSMEPHLLRPDLSPVEDEGSFRTAEIRHTQVGTYPVEYTVRTVPEPTKSPLVIVHGFLGSRPVYEGLGDRLANERETVVVKVPRDLTIDVRQERLTSMSIWAVIKAMRETSPTGQVGIVGHSMGGWIGANIASHKQRTGAIDSLTLVGSAGITNHNLLTLLPDFAKLAHNMRKNRGESPLFEYNASNVREAIWHIIGNPLRTIGEGVSVAGCQIRDTLPELAENGMNVGILQLERDELFKTAQVARIAPYLKPCRYALIPGLGHDGPIARPDVVAAHIEQMLGPDPDDTTLQAA